MAARKDRTLHAVTPIAGYRQVTTAEFKSWAEANGYTVSQRQGRMPMAAVHAYNHDGSNVKGRRQYVIGTKAQPEVTYDYTTAAGRESTFKAQPKEVRAWAKANGFESIPDRGRFSAEVRNAYGQAHAPARKRKAKASAE